MSTSQNSCFDAEAVCNTRKLVSSRSRTTELEPGKVFCPWSQIGPRCPTTIIFFSSTDVSPLACLCALCSWVIDPQWTMCQCARRKAILLRRRGCHSEQRSFGFIRSHREVKVALLHVSRVIFRETQIHPRLVTLQDDRAWTWKSLLSMVPNWSTLPNNHHFLLQHGCQSSGMSLCPVLLSDWSTMDHVPMCTSKSNTPQETWLSFGTAKLWLYPKSPWGKSCAAARLEGNLSRNTDTPKACGLRSSAACQHSTWGLQKDVVGRTSTNCLRSS